MMNLKKFASEFLSFDIKSNIEHTGMSDSSMQNTISFLDNPRFARDINNNLNIVAVLVKEKNANLLDERIEAIISENPKSALFTLHNEYCARYFKYADNKIAESAKIHPTAYVAPTGVTIGENVVIYPHATILSGIEIGDDSTIGPNSVIGAEGFHVFEDLNGIKQIVFHDGCVKIGKHVDIQSTVAVDKGLMGRDTIISDECKIDNFVHVAHRVHIGERTLLAGTTGIGGSCNIGKNVWIGGNSILSNRVTIGDNAKVTLGSVVIRNVKENTVVSGNFAMPHSKHLSIFSALN